MTTGLSGSTCLSASSSLFTKASLSRQECSTPSGSTASCSSCHATIELRLLYLATTREMNRFAAARSSGCDCGVTSEPSLSGISSWCSGTYISG